MDWQLVARYFTVKSTVFFLQCTNSSPIFAITLNSSMFEKVVILSKIKNPHLKVNSLLLVSNEILDSHFVPEISTWRGDFLLVR